MRSHGNTRGVNRVIYIYEYISSKKPNRHHTPDAHHILRHIHTTHTTIQLRHSTPAPAHRPSPCRHTRQPSAPCAGRAEWERDTAPHADTQLPPAGGPARHGAERARDTARPAETEKLLKKENDRTPAAPFRHCCGSLEACLTCLPSIPVVLSNGRLEERCAHDSRCPSRLRRHGSAASWRSWSSVKRPR